jgi:Spy/CpxP family protein refolding chaperone
MRKLALTLTAAALVLGMTALAASAQTQSPGAAGLHAQANNFTPIVKQTACNGTWGPWCGPGWVRRCWRGPWGALHCRCVPCY